MRHRYSGGFMSVATVIRPSILSLVTICSLCILIPLESFAKLPPCSMLFRDRSTTTARFYEIDGKEARYVDDRKVKFKLRDFVKLGKPGDTSIYVILDKDGNLYSIDSGANTAFIGTIADDTADSFVGLIKESDTSIIAWSSERMVRVTYDDPREISTLVESSDLPELAGTHMIRVIGRDEFFLIKPETVVHVERPIFGSLRIIETMNFTHDYFETSDGGRVKFESYLDFYPFSYGERAWIIFISFDFNDAAQLKPPNGNPDSPRNYQSIQRKIYGVPIGLPSLRQLGPVIPIEALQETNHSLELELAQLKNEHNINDLAKIQPKNLRNTDESRYPFAQLVDPVVKPRGFGDFFIKSSDSY